MAPPNFMAIGLQVGKLHRGESAPPALPDFEKPGLFRVKIKYNQIQCTSITSHLLTNETESRLEKNVKERLQPNVYR